MTDAAFDAAFGRFRSSPFQGGADPSGVFQSLAAMPTTPMSVATDLDFTPEIADAVNYGLSNGNFLLLPPGGLSTAINNVTNKLPGWTLVNVSGAAITVTVEANGLAPGGNSPTFTFASGAAGDEVYLEATADIGGVGKGGGAPSAIPGRLGHSAHVGVRSFSGAFTQTLDLAYLDTTDAYICDAAATVTSAGVNVVYLDSTDIAPSPTTVPRIARIRVGAKRGGAATGATGNVKITDVSLETARYTVMAAERQSLASSFRPAQFYQTSGVAHVRPNGAAGTPDFTLTSGGAAAIDGSTILTVASFATPNLTLGTANAAGVATTVIRSDATILVFDATTPAAIGTAAVGAATTAARRDHVHATGAGTPSTQAIGDAAATGTGPAAAMTDHKHAMPSFAAPGLTLGTANAAGSAATLIRSDATILAFDATTPAAVGTGAVGAATVAARRDHVHATGAGTPSTQAFGDAAATGTGPAASMTDHKHAMPANPVSYAAPGFTLGTSNSAGVATTLVRSDATILAFDGTTPAAVGTAAVGAATVAARRDHVHATGAGTPSTQAFGDAAATGSGPAASMTDHKHAWPAGVVAANMPALTGDVTTSAGAVATTIGAGKVTLAMQASLAQDLFIGRVTASTGVPETATITAAARTVLDDTTVGAMRATLAAQGLIDMVQVACSADYTLTTSAADITGVTTTYTCVAGDLFWVVGVIDFAVTVAGAGNAATGSLVVDGVTQTGAIIKLTTNLDRATATQVWLVSGLSAGSRIFKLQASKNNAAPTVVAKQTHTTLSLLRFRA